MTHNFGEVQFAVSTFFSKNSVEHVLCTAHENFSLQDGLYMLELSILFDVSYAFVLFAAFFDLWEALDYLS